MTADGLGWVDMSNVMIRDLMKAPDSSKIVGAEFQYPGTIRLLFSSPDLPVATGLIPILQPFIDGQGWEWNVQPLLLHRFFCSWRGTFPPPMKGEEASPSFSLESWSSGKASVWNAALKNVSGVSTASVGVTSDGRASGSCVVRAVSHDDAEEQARAAFETAFSGVTFPGAPDVTDLDVERAGSGRSDALISFDNHLRAHGCGEQEFGGFARCRVASALWSAIPKNERDAMQWSGGGLL